MAEEPPAPKGNEAIENTQDASATDNKSNLRKCLTFLRLYWKISFAIFWALFLLPFMLAHNSPEARCAYVVLLMAGYWVVECFPMAVTALIPVVLFPAFGILSTADTCSCYMNDTIMVFIGGLVLALAIEHSNLHLRIALTVMQLVGCSHAKLLGGLCCVTTLISMWVSNTAATAMMIPIIFAVLYELEAAGLGNVFVEIPVDTEDPNVPPEIRPTKITKAYMLGAAYCATFGGTGTLVGTGTNLTFKGIYESVFPESDGVNFTSWMIAMFPQMVINAFLTWIYLRIAFFGYLRPRSSDAQTATIGAEGEQITNQVILERYKGLGPITFHEIGVASLFSICILLWIFRKPGFVRGWSELITEIDVRDSTPVIFISILMFFIPKDPSFIYTWSRDPAKRPTRHSEGLITWQVIESKMPWSLMFLLGGGFAISKGSTASCLALRIGDSLVPLKALPSVLMLGVVTFFCATITEFTSNVGIANITLPVIAQMASMCVAMRVHPMYLMIPAAIGCSFSFRLPVGTPPNALVTVKGRIPTKWLIAGGCVPSIYSVLTQVALFPTWGVYVFGIKEFPDWAVPFTDNDTTFRCGTIWDH